MKMNSSYVIEEIIYAQKLAHVENSVRVTALSRLRKFLNLKSSNQDFTLDDLKKIWKGLYYCMYMADKPLVQENLAEDIGSLIKELQNVSQKFLFFEAALETFAHEWNGIDKFRMDKFMMLFTRFLRHSFDYMKENGWNLDEVGMYSKLLETIIICPSDNTNSKPLGLKMHLTDVILDELAKVGRENLPNDVTITFLYPFFKVLVVSKQFGFIKYVQNKIFGALIRLSDLGIQHQDDLMIGEMEIVKEENIVENDELLTEMEAPLDPRAGGVDVYIPQIKPNYAQISDIFLSLGSMPEINQKKRNTLYQHCKEFLDLEMGTYPFEDPELNLDDDVNEPRKKVIKKGIDTMKEFHEKVAGEEAPESSQSKKLRLGDFGTSIRNKKKIWKRLEKKSKEERLKEIRKGKLNPEFAMNRLMLKLAKKNKIPNSSYLCSTAAVSNCKKLKSKLLSTDTDQVASDNKESIVENSVDAGERSLQIKSGKTCSSLNNKKTKKRKGKGKSNGRETVASINSSVESENSNKKIHLAVDFGGTAASECSATTELTKINLSGSHNNSVPNSVSFKDKSSTIITKSINTDLNSVSSKKRKLTNEVKGKLNKKVRPVIDNSIKITIKEKTDRKINNSQKINKISNANEERKEEKPANLNMNRNKILKKKVSGNNLCSVIQQNRKVDKTLDLNLKKNLSSGTLKKMITSQTPKMNMIIKPQKINSKGKILKINLKQNTEHDLKHYRRILNSSPGIPFSASKRPKASVLKTTPSSAQSRKQQKKLKRLQKLQKDFKFE